MKVRGDWCYLYRAVDKTGQSLDFMLSEHSDEAAALRFLARAISANGLPRACAIDKSGANTAGLASMNDVLRRLGSDHRIGVYRSKYLNNDVEHPSHRLLCKRLPSNGSSLGEKTDQADDGLQIARICKSNFGWKRNGTYDQEGAARQRMPVRDLRQPCGVRGTKWGAYRRSPNFETEPGSTIRRGSEGVDASN